MNILVTGGLGFIGSHTVVELLNNNYNVIIVDNLVNSKINVLEGIYQISGVKPILYNVDITNELQLEKIFLENNINGVIHFAGLKAVGDSVSKPLDYYFNNVLSTILISKMCIKYNVNKFVFSSSATVYGNQQPPLHEELQLMKTTNPYGETKVMCERILADTVEANDDFAVCLLRYFNPVGAHKSGLIGESPNGIPNNLMPYVTQVAKGKLKKLRIFGDDYPTVDGTGVRDYIHVIDIAEGHVAALEKLREGVQIYNLGTGKGTSVLELVKAFEEANSIEIPFEIVGRRPGDIASAYADVSKANRDLGWSAKLNIVDMCRDAWNFEIHNDLFKEATR